MIQDVEERYTDMQVREKLCDACKIGTPDDDGNHTVNGIIVPCNATVWIKKMIPF